MTDKKLTNYVVLKFKNWIDLEQAKGFLKMKGYETEDCKTIRSARKIPKFFWLKYKKDKEFLKSVEKEIAAHLGCTLLEYGLISFEYQEDEQDIEIIGSVSVVDTKIGIGGI